MRGLLNVARLNDILWYPAVHLVRVYPWSVNSRWITDESEAVSLGPVGRAQIVCEGILSTQACIVQVRTSRMRTCAHTPPLRATARK